MKLSDDDHVRMGCVYVCKCAHEVMILNEAITISQFMSESCQIQACVPPLSCEQILRLHVFQCWCDGEEGGVDVRELVEAQVPACGKVKKSNASLKHN